MPLALLHKHVCEIIPSQKIFRMLTSFSLFTVVRASASLPHLFPTFLVDLAPPTLHLYGSGALGALDTPPRDEQPLTSLHFHCVEFSDIVPWLNKIPRAFPDLNVREIASTKPVTFCFTFSYFLSFLLSILFSLPFSSPVSLSPSLSVWNAQI